MVDVFAALPAPELAGELGIMRRRVSCQSWVPMVGAAAVLTFQ